MSASDALKRLAEQIAVLTSEYRRLLRRCAELERKVEELSGAIDNSIEPDPQAPDRAPRAAGANSPAFDRELVKAKLEEMLADLADIG